jgi:hypothetical protein
MFNFAVTLIHVLLQGRYLTRLALRWLLVLRRPVLNDAALQHVCVCAYVMSGKIAPLAPRADCPMGMRLPSFCRS